MQQRSIVEGEVAAAGEQKAAQDEGYDSDQNEGAEDVGGEVVEHGRGRGGANGEREEAFGGVEEIDQQIEGEAIEDEGVKEADPGALAKGAALGEGGYERVPDALGDAIEARLGIFAAAGDAAVQVKPGARSKCCGNEGEDQKCNLLRGGEHGERLSRSECACWRCAACLLPQFIYDGGNDFLYVAYDAVVGRFEDWRVRVPVDGDDELAFAHSGEMLDSAGDSDGEIELGLHGFSGLPDLLGVGPPSCVYDGARGSDSRAEGIGECYDQRVEGFGSSHAAPAGDDNIGLGEGDAFSGGGLPADDLDAAFGQGEFHVVLLRGLGKRLRYREGTRFDAGDDDRAAGLNTLGDAREEAVAFGLEAVTYILEADRVFDQGRVEPDRDARAVLAPATAAGDQDQGCLAFDGYLRDRRRPQLGIVPLQGRQVGNQHLAGDESGLSRYRSHVAAKHEDGDGRLSAKRPSCLRHLVGALAQLVVCILSHNQNHAMTFA